MSLEKIQEKDATVKPTDNKENQEPVDVEEPKEQEVEETEDQTEERLQKDLMRMEGLSSEGIGEEEPKSDEVEKKEDVVVEKKGKSDGVDDLIERTKNGMQKRIDALTAQKGEAITENSTLRNEIEQLRRELNQLKSKESSSDTQRSERVYTYDELDKAYEKAIVENDVELMKEIRKHERENLKRELRKEYIETTQVSERDIKRMNDEWKEIQNNFVVYSDENSPELYPGSRNELNINDPNSKLFKLAQAKYQTDTKYKIPNGMVQAVADAFRDIITLRINPKVKPKPSKEEVLVNKVKKANLKNSQGSSSSMKTEASSTSRPKSKSQELEDYVAQRRKMAGVI